MERSLCDRVELLVTAPSSDEWRAGGVTAADLLAHAGACKTCADRLDEAMDPETVFAALGKAGGLSEADESELDELLHTDEADAKEFRELVAGVLLPRLSPEAKALAAQFGDDPTVLARAAEAVSVLVRRRLDRLPREGEPTRMRPDGSIERGCIVALPAATTALEIARYTDLWAEPGSAGSDAAADPAPEAFELAKWVFLATGTQPRLLRHFRVEDWSRRSALLVPVPPSQEGEDPAIRWAPARTGLQPWVDLLFMGHAGKAGADQMLRQAKAFRVEPRVQPAALCRLAEALCGEKARSPCDAFAAHARSDPVFQSAEWSTLSEAFHVRLDGRDVLLQKVGTFDEVTVHAKDRTMDVVRHGHLTTVPAVDLVPGSVVRRR